jgi:hypothetical protein
MVFDFRSTKGGVIQELRNQRGHFVVDLMEPILRIELKASSLPRKCSTTELHGLRKRTKAHDAHSEQASFTIVPGDCQIAVR